MGITPSDGFFHLEIKKTYLFLPNQLNQLVKLNG